MTVSKSSYVKRYLFYGVLVTLCPNHLKFALLQVTFISFFSISHWHGEAPAILFHMVSFGADSSKILQLEGRCSSF